MTGQKLGSKVPPTRLDFNRLFAFTALFGIEPLQIFANIRYNPPNAMLQEPFARVEAVHARMQTLHLLDGATTLAGGVAVPASGVHVERGSALVRPEVAPAPSVNVFGLIGVFGNPEGLEELASVGSLANPGKLRGDEIVQIGHWYRDEIHFTL